MTHCSSAAFTSHAKGQRCPRKQKLLTLLMTCSALTLPQMVLAQSRTWTGATNSNYNENTNWSGSQRPVSSDAVLIESITNAPVIGNGEEGLAGSLGIGVAGTGLLTMEAGSKLILGSVGNSGIISVGGSQTTNATGGNGTLRASGLGASISGASAPYLGVAITRDSIGLVEILDGAVLTTGSGIIGSAAGSNGTVTISGAGSRWDITSGAGGVTIGSTIDNVGSGTLNILNGGAVTYPGGVGWFVRHGGAINVSGVDSLFQGVSFNSMQGSLSVTSGGLAVVNQLNLGGTLRPASLLVSGVGAKLTVATFSVGNQQKDTVLVSSGGQFFSNQGRVHDGTFAVSGAGALWQIAEASSGGTVIGAGTQTGTLSVLDGGRINSLNRFAMSLGQSATLHLAGDGSIMELASNLSVNASNVGQATGSFIIEDGAKLLTHNPTDNKFGSVVSRDLTIRSGGSWIMDGGLNSGLQLEAANVLVENGTLSAQGAVRIGQGTSGTMLTLRGADFSARALLVDSTSGNTVEIGAGAGNPPAAAGAFNVDVVSLGNGNVMVLNHSEQDYVIGSYFAGLAGQNGDPLIAHLAGDTIFAGANGGFSGRFEITGGKVRFNGSFGGEGLRTLVDSEGGLATVGGSLALGGTLTVRNGRLAPGDGVGTLNIGKDLILESNANLDFELGAPSGKPGSNSDFVFVGGNLTLDGALNVSNAGGFGGGLYRLINYVGTLTDNGLELGSVPEGVLRSDLSLQTSVNRQVNLLVAASPSSFTFWDGASTNSGNGRAEGGSGTWTVNSANWTTADGSENGKFNPDDLLIFALPNPDAGSRATATFAANALQPVIAPPSSAAGIVTVDDDEGDIGLRNGIQFAANGYLVTGQSIDLAATIACSECAPLPGKVIFRVGDGSESGADFVATVESALVGAAGLEKTDLGTLILSGANSYAGGTRVTNGTLQGNTSSLQGKLDVAAEGNLVFAQTEGGTFGGTLSGEGIFAKLGAGRLELTGDSSAFSGHTAVSTGELAVMGTLGSGHSLALDNGATLSGTGQIGGSVFVVNGIVSAGRVLPDSRATTFAQAPSNSAVGNLTIDGYLTLSSSATLAFDLGAPTGVAGVASDLITVSGDLLLDGSLNVSDAGGFGEGVYRLINYGGTLTDNGLLVGTTPEGYNSSDVMVQTSVANQVNLTVGIQRDRYTFWEGAGAQSDGTVDGGSGVWRADTTNWTSVDGRKNGLVDSAQLLVFAGQAGTVTVNGSSGAIRLSAGLQFATTDYVIEGDAIGLEGSVITMRVGDGSAPSAGYVATIRSNLSGEAALEKTDLGTLVLTGSNTYVGGTRILSGALEIANDAALGAASGLVTLNGGTLRTSSALQTGRTIEIGEKGGTLDNGLSTLGLTGGVTGRGPLKLLGSGLRTLSGNSSGFLGTTSVIEGTIDLLGTLGGQLNIASRATLIGSGQAGSLDLAGTFKPGSATSLIADFGLDGDLVVRSGSVLAIDLSASGSSDHIWVNGLATIEGGTIDVNALDPGLTYNSGATYRILTALGGRSGTFSGLIETSAFLDFSLGYDATGAFLTTRVFAQFPEVAGTFNQAQAATALTNIRQNLGSDGLVAYNALLRLAADPARMAFDAISGEIYPTLLANRQRAGLDLVGQMTQRSRLPGPEGLVFWAGGLGDQTQVDSDGNGARHKSDNSGWNLGVEMRSADKSWTAGLGGGAQDGAVNLDARASRAKTNSGFLTGYGRYGTDAEGLTVLAGFVHGSTDADVTRRIGFAGIDRQASSQVELTSNAVRLDVRYGWSKGNLALGPVTSLEQTSTKLGRVSETGADALNLTSAGRRISWSRLGVGGFARFDFARGYTDVTVRHVQRSKGAAQLDVSLASSPTTYAVRAASGSSQALRADVTSVFAKGDHWSFRGNLGTTQSSHETQVDAQLLLSYRF